MKPFFSIVLLLLLFSCNTDDSSQRSGIKNDTGRVSNADSLPNQKFTIVPEAILKDFTTWYNYTYSNIRLSQDFIGLDIDSVTIDKKAFLEKLMTGNVIAFKIGLLQGEPVYKLYPYQASDKSIKPASEQLAFIEMKNFEMEGKQIPAFNFTDINGKKYSSASTKGKLLVIKCWFIRCLACVREFPECNMLVEENVNRNDILFISLASDTKKDLTAFLKINPFKFNVIPLMDTYMTNQLQIGEYPTLLLVDKTGRIIKVVNSVGELKPFLTKEAGKNSR